jgi:hypothetical protein
LKVSKVKEKMEARKEFICNLAVEKSEIRNPKSKIETGIFYGISDILKMSFQKSSKSGEKMRYSLLIILLLALVSVVPCAAQGVRPAMPANEKANKRTPAPTPAPVVASAPEKTEKVETAPLPATENDGEEDGGVINVETSLVTVPFKVLDRSGRFVGGINQSEFEVYENNVKQEIAFFGTEEQPFTVALLLDVSLSTRFKIDEIQNAAIAFTKELRPPDKVMVIAFAGDVAVLCEPTSERQIMENAIRKTQFGYGTSLYEAVDLAINRHLAKIEGRKAIVLFTDGVDTTSLKADFYSTLANAEEKDILIYPIQYDTYNDVQQIQTGGGQIPGQTPVPGTNIPFPTSPPNPNPNGGITLPPIGNLPPITVPNPRRSDRRTNEEYCRNQPNDPNCRNYPNSRDDEDITGTRRPTNNPVGRGTGDSREEYERGAEYLRGISTRTGGRLYNVTDIFTLNSAFSQIAADLREQYSLGYYPNTERKSGQKIRIKVKVLRPKLAVAARESYTVGNKKNKIKQEKLRVNSEN